MTTFDHADTAVRQLSIGWNHLRLSSSASTTPAWCERLLPGVILLLDTSGEYAAQWLPVLAGRVPPHSGQCDFQALKAISEGELSGAVPSHAGHVFWRNPREPLERSDMLVSEWLAQTAKRWPHWSVEAWQLHVQGFALEPQLDKPLWHLSTGSLRKLWMAAALASGAPITFLDEPIAGLDASSVRYLCQALDALGETLAQDACIAAGQQRWIFVAHWEPLTGVTWDDIVELPNPAA